MNFKIILKKFQTTKFGQFTPHSNSTRAGNLNAFLLALITALDAQFEAYPQSLDLVLLYRNYSLSLLSF